MKAFSLLGLVILCSCSSQSKKLISPDLLVSRQEGFRQCYLESDSYKGRKSTEKGIVQISYSISPKGIVDDEKIHETSFKDANFHACLLGIVSQIHFENLPTEKPIKVIQPINFYPSVK